MEAGGEATVDGARRRAAPALRAHVADYHGYRMVGPPGRHRGLPSPFLTLIITLGEPLIMAAHPDPRQAPGVFDALVGGLHDRPATIVHPGRACGIQVALHPLGARDLLGLPAGELARLDLPFPDVAGPWASRLRERLLGEPTWAARFDVLDDELTARLRTAREPRWNRDGASSQVRRAWASLVGPQSHPGPTMPVGGLAADLGWSPRRLHGTFVREVGLGPVQALRVARFDRARRGLFSRAADGAPLDLAGLAVAHGYYDQAHLAREFRALAGCAPSRLVAEELRFVQAAGLEDDATWDA